MSQLTIKECKMFIKYFLPGILQAGNEEKNERKSAG